MPKLTRDQIKAWRAKQQAERDLAAEIKRAEEGGSVSFPTAKDFEREMDRRMGKPERK